MHDACNVIDTACMVQAVSLTPHAQKNFRTTSKSENHIQHRMHGARSVIDTKCMMHAVSLTPHAQKIFRTTSKSENHAKQRWYANKIKNACGVNNTACKVHVVSMTLHARSTNDSKKKPLKGISIKNIYVLVPNCPTSPQKNV
jgi:acetylglutamate kinase